MTLTSRAKYFLPSSVGRASYNPMTRGSVHWCRGRATGHGSRKSTLARVCLASHLGAYHHRSGEFLMWSVIALYQTLSPRYLQCAAHKSRFTLLRSEPTIKAVLEPLRVTVTLVPGCCATSVCLTLPAPPLNVLEQICAPRSGRPQHSQLIFSD